MVPHIFRLVGLITAEKAALHQVIRPAKRKQCLMFLIWLVLLPQMQAFATPLSCHLQTQLSMLQAFP
ncbi:hypothetical protein BU188_10525 [Enterococcus faecium]|nr:hypothetical protein BU188_10525 [Enterococcus faecium]